MRSFTLNVLPFALITALGLSACAGTKAPLNTTATTITNNVLSTTNAIAPLTNAKTQATINNIINTTKTVCNFVPQTLSVAALLSTNKGVSSVSNIVSSICDSVANAKTSAKRFKLHRYGMGKTVIVNVNGVVVRGNFVD